MINKIENKNPKTSFITANGIKTPNFIWCDIRTGIKDITKKGVQNHIDRLNKMGITPDMTDKQVEEQAKKYIEQKKEVSI